MAMTGANRKWYSSSGGLLNMLNVSIVTGLGAKRNVTARILKCEDFNIIAGKYKINAL